MKPVYASMALTATLLFLTMSIDWHAQPPEVRAAWLIIWLIRLYQTWPSVAKN